MAQVTLLRNALLACHQKFHSIRSNEPGWGRQHPYDRTHGPDTSGSAPGFLLRQGDPLDASTTVYGSGQPSIIRAALATIPNPEQCHFVDFGCGKGRPMCIALEFNFAAISGVELSANLAKIARRNLARLAWGKRNIRVVTGDALEYRLPEQDLVVFMYNPFANTTERLLANIEASLVAVPRNIYIVSYNPVTAELFDASPMFERRYAGQLKYDLSEIGYGPDESDAVVIWQNRGNSHPKPAGNFDAPVVIVKPPHVLAAVVSSKLTEEHKAAIGKPPTLP